MKIKTISYIIFWISLFSHPHSAFANNTKPNQNHCFIEQINRDFSSASSEVKLKKLFLAYEGEVLNRKSADYKAMLNLVKENLTQKGVQFSEKRGVIHIAPNAQSDLNKIALRAQKDFGVKSVFFDPLEILDGSGVTAVFRNQHNLNSGFIENFEISIDCESVLLASPTKSFFHELKHAENAHLWNTGKFDQIFPWFGFVESKKGSLNVDENDFELYSDYFSFDEMDTTLQDTHYDVSELGKTKGQNQGRLLQSIEDDLIDLEFIANQAQFLASYSNEFAKSIIYDPQLQLERDQHFQLTKSPLHANYKSRNGKQTQVFVEPTFFRSSGNQVFQKWVILFKEEDGRVLEITLPVISEKTNTPLERIEIFKSSAQNLTTKAKELYEKVKTLQMLFEYYENKNFSAHKEEIQKLMQSITEKESFPGHPDYVPFDKEKIKLALKKIISKK